MEHRFECTKCGQCCRRPGVIALSNGEVQRIARHLEVTAYDLTMDYGFRLEDDAWWLEVSGGESCVFLVDDKCSINDVKPVQCRTYPFWPEIVLEEGAWEEEKQYCPGIGVGRPHTAEEIEAALNSLDSDEAGSR